MKKIYSIARALSLSALLGTGGLKAQYCTQMANSTADDEIFNVTFGTLNNTSNCSQTGGAGSFQNRYSDYTTLVTPPNLLMGNNYPMSITGGQCGGGSYCGYMYVWIDFNQNGSFTDPGENVWVSSNVCWAITGTPTSKTGGVTIPFTATPGITRMRVTLVEGTVSGPCVNYTWGETEDYNVNIILPPPCSGAPSANAVVTPTNAICPNSSALLSLSTTYTTYGFTYQWTTSTVSAVGPFTAVPSATMTTYNTPTLNIPTYYQVVITCTNGNTSTLSASGQVSIQPVIVNTVPYFEGFEGIANLNQLPNCSWSSTSPGSVARTYTAAQNQQRVARTGNKFASFYYSPSGTNYFYTNGIQMEAGVTYSASVWFATNYYGDLNWTDMSILLGTSQSTTGLVNIANSGGPAASSGYMPISNTFTVANSGIYYVAIRGTSSGGCCAYHLNWDDLRIEAPCSLNPVNLSLTTSTTTICEGDAVTLTAAGAMSYAWSHGPTTAAVVENPTQSTIYTVVGTNTASGCSTTLNQYINVLPKPQMVVYSDKNVVCAGKPAVIVASGASTYSWSTNSNSNFITVNPTTGTTYTVIGANAAGCTSQMTHSIGVNPLPTVTGSADRSDICRGESATLSGGGAASYQWASNSNFLTGQSVIVSPNVPTTYTLTGTDANGCSNMTTLTENVLECVGIAEVTTTQSGVKVYPNPTGGVLTVELSNSADKTVSVIDVTGRVVITLGGASELMNINLNSLSNGIYYVKIQSAEAVEVVKVVKN